MEGIMFPSCQEGCILLCMTDVQLLLQEISKLMELKGENPFKIRAFEKAASILAGYTDLKERAKAGSLTEISGVGKTIADIVAEFVLTGKVSFLDELRNSLPVGLVEFTQIPGLGPKKAKQLITELEIHSIAELEYACRENRLLALKGFGDKIQNKILEGIVFLRGNQGQHRLVDVLPIAENFLKYLSENGLFSGENVLRICETGALRRKLETICELEFLVQEMDPPSLKIELEKIAANFSFPVRLHYASSDCFGSEWVRTTATSEHWNALGAPSSLCVSTEDEFYSKLGLPWIAPEMRETGEEVLLARSSQLSDVLPWKRVQGIFHNHTVFSDGSATIEEMVLEAKHQGYQYIGISDHSQSAFYARGLKPEDLLAQEKEIKRVQEAHPEIRIFWGIESDILADGSLDYEPKWLKKFDFVIASVHSRFQMDRETMTARILEAVRNPYTRFLGHLTGRILLGRKGYDIHIEKIIAEAAARDVAIEINANPSRLDIDWRWGAQLRKYSAQVSIHPDAHDRAGISDMVFGIGVARKALLPESLVLNSKSVKEVEKWLKRE